MFVLIGLKGLYEYKFDYIYNGDENKANAVGQWLQEPKPFPFMRQQWETAY